MMHANKLPALASWEMLCSVMGADRTEIGDIEAPEAVINVLNLETVDTVSRASEKVPYRKRHTESATRP